MQLKNRIKEWRARKDVTQEVLAKEVEMSRQSIHSIERGKFIPSTLTAFKLARFFNTTVEEIFYVEEE
jgi:putative transcriptional regulator